MKSSKRLSRNQRVAGVVVDQAGRRAFPEPILEVSARGTGGDPAPVHSRTRARDHFETASTSHPERWIVLYDGGCGLCMWLLAGILRWDRRRLLEPVALQDPSTAQLLGDLAPDARMSSWHLISPAGRRYSGGDALPPMLRELPLGTGPALVLARTPRLTDRGYRWVATNRGRLARLVPARWKRSAAALVGSRTHRT